MDWCKTPDAGLPAPDLLIHMQLGEGEARTRGGYGTERYEVPEFQAKVKLQVRILFILIFQNLMNNES
jgi:dTMP kinase